MLFKILTFRSGCLAASVLAFAGLTNQQVMAAPPLGQVLPSSIAKPLAVEAIALESTSPFAKWAAMLRRKEPQGEATPSPARARWQALIATVAGLGLAEQMAAVNAAINAIPYRTDRANWGVEDYWASPVEFLMRGAGDCEDFAIAKYFALRALGFPVQRLYLLNYRDARIGMHMVLVVETTDGAIVMDNRHRAIRPLAAYAPIKPLYAINETGAWWLTRAR